MLFNPYEAEQILNLRTKELQQHAEEVRLTRIDTRSRKRTIQSILKDLRAIFSRRDVTKRDCSPCTSR
jgi:hypothetical protein